MENNVVETNKKKNLIIGVMACIIVLLIAALVYFIFIKKEDKSVDNNGENNQQEKVEDNNKYVDDTEFKAENFDVYINKLKADSTIKNVKYEFHEIEPNYEYEQLDGSDDISIKLSQDKKIILLYDDGSNVTISNVLNVKDYVGVLYGNYVYIITDNGDVYKYSTNDDEFKDKAVKLTNIKNANKFVYISYEFKDELYISTGLGIVDKNNNYIELADITGL